MRPHPALRDTQIAGQSPRRRSSWSGRSSGNTGSAVARSSSIDHQRWPRIVALSPFVHSFDNGSNVEVLTRKNHSSWSYSSPSQSQVNRRVKTIGPGSLMTRPVSSRVSRIAASYGVSPCSRPPPTGNHHGGTSGLVRSMPLNSRTRQRSSTRSTFEHGRLIATTSILADDQVVDDAAALRPWPQPRRWSAGPSPLHRRTSAQGHRVEDGRAEAPTMR